MKINEKVLSIPPHISTSWLNVKALRVEEGILIVSLYEGAEIKIPGLAQEAILLAFDFHQKAIESKVSPKGFSIQSIQADPTIRFGMVGMEQLGGAMQHSFEMRDAPPLPQEILSKVEAVAKVIAPEIKTDLPKAEPHCNCPHCQIARAIERGLHGEAPVIKHHEEEEVVAIEELQFQQWEIEQTGHQLFSVTNKIDANEKYSVFLGHPVGCTCGKQGCDHILAVLRS
jgi:hypothetical protein